MKLLIPILVLLALPVTAETPYQVNGDHWQLKGIETAKLVKEHTNLYGVTTCTYVNGSMTIETLLEYFKDRNTCPLLVKAQQTIYVQGNWEGYY
ncbi:MAG: hypothetical protein HRU18_02770 [Pseudoalteromonas sp.]|uniref:hypothetical protein n=1 Tax=Pseudoalteromonas sp. TaxID=53249 RepID=UPI001D2C2124|nr:hypothetical protein [Pseudoalteromonas sp.]NRA77107.1 hypothetical protein [Pseudoalteromonas sp.]